MRAQREKRCIPTRHAPCHNGLMSGEVNPAPAECPAAVLIAVPEDAVDEMADEGLVRVIPTLRGPVFDTVVTVGVDSATVVTLMQAPGQVRAFSAWLVAW